MGNPYVGWEPWSAGCHWDRALPDGRKILLSTWSRGVRSGYSLTLDFETRVFADLDAANAAYEFLAAAPGRHVADAPGALDEY